MNPCELCEEYGDHDCKHCTLGNPCIGCVDYDMRNDACTSEGACGDPANKRKWKNCDEEDVYPIDRSGQCEDIFLAWLQSHGFDDYGNWLDTRLIPYIDETGRFENAVFALFPYYWGDDEVLQSVPNFVYKPDDVRICWYKYPLREAYANRPLTEEKLADILDVCSKSLKQLYK